MPEHRRGDTESHLIKDLNWRTAEADTKRKVKNANISGLIYMCAAPNCEGMQELLFFKHPQNGYEMYLCTFHWRQAQFESKKLNRKYDTQVNFIAKSGVLDKLARDNGGKLPSIRVREMQRVRE